MNKLIHPITLTTLLFPALAFAHIDMHEAINFTAGFNHPITGADHILAMLAVGFWAAQLGQPALWAMPSTFITCMILGGTLGIFKIHVPFIETGILSSVLILGLLIATSARFSLHNSLILIGCFATFHGLAHGMEMPTNNYAVMYSLGFALTTATLHGIGIILGIGLQTIPTTNWHRLVGSIIALGGVYLAIT